MRIDFHSVVLFVEDFQLMKEFYTDVLHQEIEQDFGNSIGFKGGLSLWQLKENYHISKELAYSFHKHGNRNLEVCFETDEFDEVIKSLENHKIEYLHKTVEEIWGQQTIRFYDPENNLVEIGESLRCFAKRFYDQGMNFEEVSERTHIPIELVKKLID